MGLIIGRCGVAVALAAAAALSACNRTPAEEVVATVNGDTVTRDDFAAEARAAGATDKAAQEQLLGQIVNRKLLAQAALEQNIDSTPEFEAEERRARESALVEALMAKLIGDKAKPGPAAIKNFVAQNPAMFGTREVLKLEQIQVAAALVDGAWLHPANSLADAARILDEHHVPFQRGSATADTAGMPPELVKQLAEHPNEPFAIRRGDNLVISQVANRQRAAVPPAQADAVAAAEIRRRATQETVAKTLADLRAKAKIVYGKDVTPPPAPEAGKQ